MGEPAERRRPEGAVEPLLLARKSIDSLGEGVQSFRRWGFEQGQAPLIGAMGESEPIPAALAAAIAGTRSPEQAARDAQRAVQQLAAAAG